MAAGVILAGCLGVRTDSRGPLLAEAFESAVPLVVRNAIGGQVYETSILVRALGRARRPVRIERDCLSACGMLLKLENLCYTADARFGFHAAADSGRRRIDPGAQALLMQHYPPGVREWFSRSGAGRVLNGFRYLSGAELARLDDRPRLCDGGAG